ncbi:hypothetical protein HG441_003880 [Candidatus Saccharibacteria bacterium]|jgi:hypothetical protein|nr:hypothetical protein [Candidatus Saccharibacteria bacterium]
MEARNREKLVEIFRFKVQELERHLSSPTKLSLIECSSILRLLLLSDECGLFGNLARDIPGFRTRKRGRKIVMFNAQLQADSHIRDLPSGGYVHAVVRGDAIPENSPRVYSRDDFLKLSVIEVQLSDGKVITMTVRDVIKFIANKLGGVHFDYSPREEKNQILYQLDDKYQLQIAGSVIFSIKGLSEIVLATCKRVDERLVGLGY